MKRRLILVDDHPMVLQGLRHMVRRADDLAVVGEAADGAAAEALARRLPADLLLLDVGLPGQGGVQVLQALRRDGIALRVLFYSMVPIAQYAAYLRRAGAQGIVGKEVDEATLLQAIRGVLAGQTVFPVGTAAPRGRPGQGVAALSPREAQVLQGLLDGQPLVALAQQLGVGVPSVTTYRRRVLDKLGVANNAELIKLMSR
jgi:two-component system, NarL family, invasion response regulator UvrY